MVAPSVITLNATAAALAVNDFLFDATGLRRDAGIDHLRVLPRRRRVMLDEPRKDSACPECGFGITSRFARDDSVELPVR